MARKKKISGNSSINQPNINDDFCFSFHMLFFRSYLLRYGSLVDYSRHWHQEHLYRRVRTVGSHQRKQGNSFHRLNFLTGWGGGRESIPGIEWEPSREPISIRAYTVYWALGYKEFDFKKWRIQTLWWVQKLKSKTHLQNRFFDFLSRFLRVWLQSFQKVPKWPRKFLFYKKIKKDIKNAEFHADFESVKKKLKNAQKMNMSKSEKSAYFRQSSFC